MTSFDLRELTFGKSAFVPIEGFNLHVARGGYTGEDGFEVCNLSYFCGTLPHMFRSQYRRLKRQR
jgi:hypothetical protein